MLNKLFKLDQKHTTVKTEILAGVTTFLAMAYILGVNPAILGDAGMDMSAVFMATAISSGVACLIMGLLANYPVALAPGMGVNALFAYTICLGMGYSWQAALAAVFVSGIVFVLISVTGVRKLIIDAIPVQLKTAIGAGIGFFIAFVGFKNAGIIIANESTFVGLGNLGDPAVLLAVFGILVTIFCLVRKVPAAVFVGLVITAILGIILGLFGLENMPMLPADWGINFDFSAVGACFSGFGELFANPMSALVIIFSFLFVDFFDTAGTLVAVGNSIGLVNRQGNWKTPNRLCWLTPGYRVRRHHGYIHSHFLRGIHIRCCGGRPHRSDRLHHRRAVPAVHLHLSDHPERHHQCRDCSGSDRGGRPDGPAAAQALTGTTWCMRFPHSSP